MVTEQEVIAEENLEAETDVKMQERCFDQQCEKCERILYYLHHGKHMDGLTKNQQCDVRGQANTYTLDEKEVEYSIYTQKQATTKYTTFYLMFGRHPNSPQIKLTVYIVKMTVPFVAPDQPEESLDEQVSERKALYEVIQEQVASRITINPEELGPLSATLPYCRLVALNNPAENWKNYKQVWQNYAIITNLKAQTEQYRVALFLHCIGPEALKVYNGMQFADETERNTLASIHKKFDEFTIGEVNETYERYIFNGRNQGQDESIEAYIAALRTLAKTCGFCECLADSLLRDRIVLGIHNNSLRKRLLQERNLDLKKCIDLCRSSEAAASHLKNISAVCGKTISRGDTLTPLIGA
ncbi:Hypothetical predicted protein, partial [Paramuricea clavata]